MATAHRKTGEKERIAERRRQVFALRKAGASVRRIAEQMGINPQMVFRDLNAELGFVTQELRHEVDNVRALEIARCDDALVSIAPKVREGDFQAIETARKLWARITFLKGAEPSTRVEHSLSPEAVKLWQELEVKAKARNTDGLVMMRELINALDEQKVEAE